MISDRDVAVYHEHGYLVVPGLLERSSVSVEARVRPAPVRMPLSPAIHQGSISENQSDASRRYFGGAQESAEAART